MKKLLNLLSIVIMSSVALNSYAASICFNSLGYLPNQPKVATVSSEFESFQLVDAKSGKVVFENKTSEPVSQSDVNITVRFADFSAVTTVGTYFIKVSDSVKSPVFPISSSVYNSAFYTSMRAFYLWRCGTAVDGMHNGAHFSHEACHLEDGWLDSIGYPNKQKDGAGGWHDAGDHGKYVVNAGITVGMMFVAWEQFNNKLKDYDFDLPKSKSKLPDFLEEIKWETDWLLKMTYPDGSGKVSHKLTRTNFEGFVLPELDTEKRFFTVWSSAATADFVAVMAQAARYFKPYDKAYAQKCLDAAVLSYNFLKANPEDHKFEHRGFNTGGYQSADDDDRTWAAAELWETTGNAEYLADLETRLTNYDKKVDEVWDWGGVKNMAAFCYIQSKRSGKNEKLLSEVKKQAIEIANTIVSKAKADVFARPLGEYYWGSNGTVVRQVYNLQVANSIQPDKKYVETSLDAIAHIFGRNLYGRSQVTGVGVNPPMNPHDRRSGGDTVVDPWPGYLVGGGTKATDWQDDWKSYSTNEVAINWQAALVYALAWFIE